jgi:hypothetical protein
MYIFFMGNTCSDANSYLTDDVGCHCSICQTSATLTVEIKDDGVRGSRYWYDSVCDSYPYTITYKDLNEIYEHYKKFIYMHKRISIAGDFLVNYNDTSKDTYDITAQFFDRIVRRKTMV